MAALLMQLNETVLSDGVLTQRFEAGTDRFEVYVATYAGVGEHQKGTSMLSHVVS